jgi:molybdopterin molybdotransferase
MLELESAIERILTAMPSPQPERIGLHQAHHRVLAGRIVCPLDLPGFDNSAMDGYAVRAADLLKANLTSPVSLQVRGRIAAGEIFSGEVTAGSCVRIFTGSPLPRGADAVVMQEDTRVDPGQPGVVWFPDAVKPWENIRFRGEDLKQGAVLAEPGSEITAARLNLLAAAGLTHLDAGRRPVVGLLATGSELIEGGQPLMPGKIYESNRAGLAAQSSEAGGIPKIFPLVKDSLADTHAALENAFTESDLVVTSGGVSVGEMDFIKSAFELMGGKLEFWKIAIRPGRPFVFGRCGNKFLFGLPGNPVSAFVTFLLLVRPALLRWQGATVVTLPVQHGLLAEPLSNPDGRRHFMRVTIDSAGKIRSAGAQASHLLASLAAANGLLDVPPHTTLAAGENVRVLRWS